MASSALDTVKGLAKQATLDYITTARRIAKDTLYRTLEDFSRTDTSRKRLVVIGLTGSGKSTLLNVMAGWRFVQSKETDYEFIWKKKGEGDDAASPLFDSAASSESVTKVAAFANVDFRGDPDRPLTVVDTPGHDDSAAADIDTQEARDALGAIAADLHNKLKALGTVHALLVVHNDVASNRLNPATYQLLKMVDEKVRQLRPGATRARAPRRDPCWWGVPAPSLFKSVAPAGRRSSHRPAARATSARSWAPREAPRAAPRATPRTTPRAWACVAVLQGRAQRVGARRHRLLEVQRARDVMALRARGEARRAAEVDSRQGARLLRRRPGRPARWRRDRAAATLAGRG